MPDRSLRPLACAGAVAVVSIALLAVAVGADWLGPDVGRGANFCEAARDAVVLQPANSFSNLGFVVAGLVIAWHAGRIPRDKWALNGLATPYACLVVLLGPASAAMHATQSEVGGQLDLLSMYLVASFAAAYAVLRWYRRDRVFFWQLFLLLVAACELIGLLGDDVPVVQQAGNVAFAALLLTAVVVEVRLWRRHENGVRTDLRWGAGALGVILVAFAIWNVTKTHWCDPHSLLQGHGAWHLLGAVSAYLLFRLWASESTG
ncbi:ceramidase domain-containing protein [Nocardioides sp. SR21]|uniref:ceramidase domain-containing protein n=1 Tax=Nocardioides sp. SR21 TaxID=2919501 RepID=UPI001FAA8375|nr:ceramidase domain-containing protein [Nocardioides sp. SR21]